MERNRFAYFTPLHKTLLVYTLFSFLFALLFLSLLAVTQIRGHIAGSSSPPTHTEAILPCYPRFVLTSEVKREYLHIYAEPKAASRLPAHLFGVLSPGEVVSTVGTERNAHLREPASIHQQQADFTRRAEGRGQKAGGNGLRGGTALGTLGTGRHAHFRKSGSVQQADFHAEASGGASTAPTNSLSRIKYGSRGIWCGPRVVPVLREVILQKAPNALP